MTARLKLASLVSALLIAACGGPQRPRVKALAGDTVFVNVTVVPMDRDGELPGQTVIVRGDRIVAVAPSGAVELPEGVKRIDGAGKWLLPGLADMHVHTWFADDLTMFVAAGVTLVRNMWGTPLQLGWREQIARGELLGPTIVTAGPIVDGDPPIWPGSTVITDPADAERIVGEQKAAGYDFIKPYSNLQADVYAAIVAAARKQGLPVAGHVPRAVGLAAALDAGQRSVEHLDGWIRALVPEGVDVPSPSESPWKSLAVQLAHADETRIPALIQKAIAAGTWNCPTLVVLDNFARLDDPAEVREHTAWVEYVPATTLAFWDPKQDFRLQNMTPDDFKALRAGNELRRRIVAKLAAAGAPLLVGTDTGNPFVIPGASLHREIELLVAAGVPRAQVLRAATAGAAAYLGKAGEFGVVAAGARADLILVGTDPLANPLPLPPDGVMVRGRWLPGEEIQGLLAGIRQRVAAPPALWDGLPPLAPEGKVIHQAHYDWRIGGSSIGEERLAVGETPGGRVIVAQLVMVQGGIVQLSYRLTRDSTTLEGAGAKLSGVVQGGKLVVTGSDAAGKPLSLSEPMPAGAFLSAAGEGGMLALVDHLTSLKVGDKAQLSSLELAADPQPHIVATSYQVERQPDAAGVRVYAVTATLGKLSISGEIDVDAAGWLARQTWGPPFNLEVERRP